MSPLEEFVVCIAALAHDLDHPGVTNAFLVATSDPIAILYNDSAVLENHHVASLFRLLMEKPQVNVLALCDKQTLKGVRKIMLEGVLNTDMSRHFKLVAQAELFADLNRETIDLASRGNEDARQKCALLCVLFQESCTHRGAWPAFACRLISCQPSP